MSSLFQEMEEFTLFDGLVPSSGLLDYPTVEDQLDSGILFPGDSLVKPGDGPGELFEDFLSNGSVEDPFSQEWMETVDFSSLLETTPIQPAHVENVTIKSEGSSCLLEELLKKPIQIKSSPTVSQNVQIDTSKNVLNDVQIDTISETSIVDEIKTGSPSILEQAITEIDDIDALVLQQHLHDIYNESISTDTSENTSNEISLMDSSNEFLISSPLSSEDIDSILSSPEPASPSSSVQDDPDYVPSLPEEKKSRRTSRSKGNKSRATPYEVPEKVNKLDKKERKRIQNRNAAIRYREKKRAERGTIVSEEDQLASRNKELKTKVEHLTNEITYMKNLLTEVCEARGLKIQFK